MRSDRRGHRVRTACGHRVATSHRACAAQPSLPTLIRARARARPSRPCGPPAPSRTRGGLGATQEASATARPAPAKAAAARRGQARGHGQFSRFRSGNTIRYHTIPCYTYYTTLYYTNTLLYYTISPDLEALNFYRAA